MEETIPSLRHANQEQELVMSPKGRRVVVLLLAAFVALLPSAASAQLERSGTGWSQHVDASGYLLNEYGGCCLDSASIQPYEPFLAPELTGRLDFNPQFTGPTVFVQATADLRGELKSFGRVLGAMAASGSVTMKDTLFVPMGPVYTFHLSLDGEIAYPAFVAAVDFFFGDLTVAGCATADGQTVSSGPVPEGPFTKDLTLVCPTAGLPPLADGTVALAYIAFLGARSPGGGFNAGVAFPNVYVGAKGNLLDPTSLDPFTAKISVEVPAGLAISSASGAFEHSIVGPTVVTDAGPGYWRFEEGAAGTFAAETGSILDSSGSARNGTPSGNPLYWWDVPASTVPLTGAPNARSLQFDGMNDQLYFPSTFLFHAAGDATLEFWLNFNPTTHQSLFWTRADNTDVNRFNIFVNGDGTFGFDYRSPSGVLHTLVPPGNASVLIQPNTWTHMAIARSGNVYSVYEDGTLMTTAMDAAPDLPNAIGWTIAGREGYRFRGLIDEVRASLAALKPSEFLDAAAISDKTAPVIEATISPSPTASGWNPGPVLIEWFVTDPESGIASRTGCDKEYYPSDTTGTTFTCTATNGVGLPASQSVVIKIDSTPPIVTPHVSPAPNAAGWSQPDVLVTWEITDPESGPRAFSGCHSAVFGDVFTGGTSVGCEVWNGAGLQTTKSVLIKMDVSAPAIDASVSPLPNDRGWNTSDVRLSWHVSDPESGVSSVSGCDAIFFPADTTGETFKCSATNGASMLASKSVVVKIDRTPPVLKAIFTPPPNADGWNHTPVKVRWPLTDAESGIRGGNCSLNDEVFGDGLETILCYAENNAGLKTSLTTSIKVDTTGPIIQPQVFPPPNERGWNSTPVTVSWTVVDPESGVPPNQCESTQYTANTNGTTVTCTATNTAGAKTSQSVTVKIDMTPPEISCSANPSVLWPPNNTMVPVRTNVDVTDTLSGTVSGSVFGLRPFTLTSVETSEPDSGWMTGFTDVRPTIGTLKAARAGSGSGRTYTLTYKGFDLAGNSSTCRATVLVPRKPTLQRP